MNFKLDPMKKSEHGFFQKDFSDYYRNSIYTAFPIMKIEKSQNQTDIKAERKLPLSGLFISI